MFCSCPLAVLCEVGSVEGLWHQCGLKALGFVTSCLGTGSLWVFSMGFQLEFSWKKNNNPTNQTIANNGRDIRMYLESILCCILSDLTSGSDSGLRVLSTVCSCIDRWSSPWRAYKLRRPGGTNSHVMVKGSVTQKYPKNHVKSMDQGCFFNLSLGFFSPNCMY